MKVTNESVTLKFSSLHPVNTTETETWPLTVEDTRDSMKIATVLLAEDDLDDAFLVQRAFKRAELPHRIVHLADGQQTVDFLTGTPPFQRPAAVPDLLLLDLKMPRMDGFEVLEWLRCRPEFKSMRTVVLSSSDHEADISKARALGATDYFRKPGDPAELVRIVSTVHERWLRLQPPSERIAAAA